jgi:hypothetical protein
MAEETEKKNKKVNKMSVQELDAALKKTEETMKGLTSKYAKALISRKKELQSK